MSRMEKHREPKQHQLRHSKMKMKSMETCGGYSSISGKLYDIPFISFAPPFRTEIQPLLGTVAVAAAAVYVCKLCSY